MIGYIRIADIPKFIISMVVGVILVCAFFALLSADALKRIPGWIFGGAMILILAASITAGHYIWEWIDDWRWGRKLRRPERNVYVSGHKLGKAIAVFGRRFRSKKSATH